MRFDKSLFLTEIQGSAYSTCLISKCHTGLFLPSKLLYQLKVTRKWPYYIYYEDTHVNKLIWICTPYSTTRICLRKCEFLQTRRKIGFTISISNCLKLMICLRRIRFPRDFVCRRNTWYTRRKVWYVEERFDTQFADLIILKT